MLEIYHPHRHPPEIDPAADTIEEEAEEWDRRGYEESSGHLLTISLYGDGSLVVVFCSCLCITCTLVQELI